MIFKEAKCEFVVAESLPDTPVNFHVKDMALEAALKMAESIADIAVSREATTGAVKRRCDKCGEKPAVRYVVCRRKGDVLAGQVRVFQVADGGAWTFAVSKASAPRIFGRLRAISDGFHGKLDKALQELGVEADEDLGDLSLGPISVSEQSQDAIVETLVSSAKKALKPRAPEPADPVVMRVWPLTFVGTSLPVPSKADAIGKDGMFEGAGHSLTGTADNMVKSLADIFKDQLTVKGVNNNIILQGKQSAVDAARMLLAKWVDVPFSQVKFDVWMVQGNSRSTRGGSREVAQANLRLISAGVDVAKRLSAAAVGLLYKAIQDKCSDALSNNSVLYAASALRVKSADALSRAVGFDPNVHRPLGPADALLFLGVSSNANRAIEKAEKAFSKVLASEEALVKNDPPNKAVPAESAKGGPVRNGVQSQAESKFQKLLDRINARFESQGLFRTLKASINGADRQATAHGLLRFMRAWSLSQGPIDSDALDLTAQDLSRIDVPAELSSAGTSLDMLLKAGASRLSEDIEDAITKPLLDWIREDIQAGSMSKSGVDMVGQTSLSVTSRLPGGVLASSESFFPYQPRPVLTKEMLTDFTLAGRKEGPKLGEEKTMSTAKTEKQTGALETGKTTETATSDTTKTEPILGPGTLKTLIGELTNMEALLLNMALNEPDLVYSRLAPGVTLGFRPTVLRDGASARVQIFLRTGIEATQPDLKKARTDGPPLDLVRSHTLQTDVHIGAFETFGLSTYSMATSGPGEPSWRLPILEMLPIIGKYFVGPRRNETVHQESVILVNVTIIPRSLDLAGKMLK